MNNSRIARLMERLSKAREIKLLEQIVLLVDMNGFTELTYKVEGTENKSQFRDNLYEFFERSIYKADLIRNDCQLVNVVGDAIIISIPVSDNLNDSFLDVLKIAKKIHDWAKEHGPLSVKCAIDVGFLTKIIPYREKLNESHILPILYVGNVLNRVSRLLASGNTKKHLRISQQLYGRLPNDIKINFESYCNIKYYPGKSFVYKSKVPLDCLQINPQNNY